jgi:hypothetical protein
MEILGKERSGVEKAHQVPQAIDAMNVLNYLNLPEDAA